MELAHLSDFFFPLLNRLQPDRGGWVWEYLTGAGNEMYEVQLPVAVRVAMAQVEITCPAPP